MAGKPTAGDGLTENLAGMTKNQLYDIMSQMKTLIEQNKQQARKILIQNPLLTKALFQAQIMLGMVQPPQVAWSFSLRTPQQPQQSSHPSQPSNVQATNPLPGQAVLHEQMVASQIQPPLRKQHQNQTSMPMPSTSAHPSNLQSQPMPLHPLQAPQQPKGHLNPQVTPLSVLQSSQLQIMPPPPLHSASQPPNLHQPQVSAVSIQLQQPLQKTGIPQLPLKPPMPPQPRLPSVPSIPHPYGPQMGPNVGFQHSGVPQHPSQSMFHGQLPPSSHLPPPYQVRGSHLRVEFNNQGGSPLQVDRGSWMSGPLDSSIMTQLPAPQLLPGNQPAHTTPLIPEMEKALLQQVMSLTPEQINLLPPGQRNQVLQLQQMLRQ